MTTTFARAISEEDEYLSRRLIAAHPIGGLRGENFDSTPICGSDDQTGWVVSFASYRAREMPLDPVPEEGEQRVCVNPAALGGGEAVLDPYFPKDVNPTFGLVIEQRAPDFPFAEPGMPEITTPFISMPDFVSAECVHDPEVGHVLEVTVMPGDGRRADDFNGEIPLIFDERNLHIVDMTLTMGDLVRLATSQAESWLAR